VNTRTLTQVIVLGAVVALIGYDVWVYVEPSPSDTISEIMLAWARLYPELPFAFGILAGHLFVPFKRTRSIPLLGAVCVVFVLVARLFPIPLAVALVAGLITGSTLWSQAKS